MNVMKKIPLKIDKENLSVSTDYTLEMKEPMVFNYYKQRDIKLGVRRMNKKVENILLFAGAIAVYLFLIMAIIYLINHPHEGI